MTSTTVGKIKPTAAPKIKLNHDRVLHTLTFLIEHFELLRTRTTEDCQAKAEALTKYKLTPMNYLHFDQVNASVLKWQVTNPMYEKLHTSRYDNNLGSTRSPSLQARINTTPIVMDCMNYFGMTQELAEELVYKRYNLKAVITMFKRILNINPLFGFKLNIIPEVPKFKNMKQLEKYGEFRKAILESDYDSVFTSKAELRKKGDIEQGIYRAFCFQKWLKTAVELNSLIFLPESDVAVVEQMVCRDQQKAAVNVAKYLGYVNISRGLKFYDLIGE